MNSHACVDSRTCVRDQGGEHEAISGIIIYSQLVKAGWAQTLFGFLVCFLEKLFFPVLMK